MNHYPNLKILRLQHNYKQEYVADTLGISQPEYSKLETGHRKLDAISIRNLCKLYDVSSELLLRLHVIQPVAPKETPQPVSQKNPDLSSHAVLMKMMENYSFLLDSYLRQQQVQEKIIDKLIGNNGQASPSF